jgi:hypothetical protein
LTSCAGWLLDVSIDNDHAILSIKTEEDGQILKLTDPYHPEFYVLPRNDSDGLHLFQILSREEIAVSWENKHVNLFDSKKTRKLIHIQLRSLRYYQPLLKKLENDYRVKELFNTDFSHVQQYLFNKLRIEPTSKVKVQYDDGSKLLEVVKVDDNDDIHPPPFSVLYFDLHTYSGILASDDSIRVIKVRYEKNEVVFDNGEEKVILQQFSDYVREKS